MVCVNSRRPFESLWSLSSLVFATLLLSKWSAWAWISDRCMIFLAWIPLVLFAGASTLHLSVCSALYLQTLCVVNDEETSVHFSAFSYNLWRNTHNPSELLWLVGGGRQSASTERRLLAVASQQRNQLRLDWSYRRCHHLVMMTRHLMHSHLGHQLRQQLHRPRQPLTMLLWILMLTRLNLEQCLLPVSNFSVQCKQFLTSHPYHIQDNTDGKAGHISRMRDSAGVYCWSRHSIWLEETKWQTPSNLAVIHDDLHRLDISLDNVSQLLQDPVLWRRLAHDAMHRCAAFDDDDDHI